MWEGIRVYRRKCGCVCVHVVGRGVWVWVWVRTCGGGMGSIGVKGKLRKTEGRWDKEGGMGRGEQMSTRGATTHTNHPQWPPQVMCCSGKGDPGCWGINGKGLWGGGLGKKEALEGRGGGGERG